MMKKRVVVSDADDYEVRIIVSQNCVTATLCTEEFFLRTHYLKLSPHISR
jgi:hypothetical protein